MTALLWGHQQNVKPSLPWECVGWERCSPQVKKGALIGAGDPTYSAGTVAGPSPTAESKALLKAWPGSCSGTCASPRLQIPPPLCTSVQCLTPQVKKLFPV